MTDMRRVHNSTLNPLVVSSKGRRVLGCSSDTIDVSEPRAQKYINQGILLLINTTPDREPVTRPEDQEPVTKPAEDADTATPKAPAPADPKATSGSATPQPADEAPAESPAPTPDTKKSTNSK